MQHNLLPRAQLGPQPIPVGEINLHIAPGSERDPSIGSPVTFQAGQFAGQTIRAELHELQKADLGRKFAKKDRRPIDPPPIVQLHLFRVYGVGTEHQYEQEIPDYGEVHPDGFICFVDLFELVPASEARHPSTSYRYSQNTAVLPNRTSIGGGMTGPAFLPPNPAFYAEMTAHVSSPTGSAPGVYTSGTPGPAWPHHLAVDPATGEAAVPEMRTEELAGATFVQLFSVVRVDTPMLVFTFSDLSVRAEGLFTLRYRCFDILSMAMPVGTAGERPVFAECFGGPFRVYGTKEFPGLAKSTKLTKELSLAGVRANTRETERKGTKRPHRDSPSPPADPPGGSSMERL